MHPTFCTACGKPTNPQARFCTSCGHHFEDVTPPPATPPSAAPVAPPPPVPPAGASAPIPAPMPAPMPAPAGAPDAGRRRSTVIIAVLAVLLLVAAAVAVFAFTRGDDGGNEVVLEPAAVDVPDPFTSPVSIDERALTSTPSTTSTSAASSSSTATTATTAVPAAGAAGGQVVGGAPGLYGGTRDAGSCDPDKLVAFLEADAAKAKAWAEVQGIAPAEIRSFVAGLTPVVLRRDTRVTNHGYRDGKATPRQAVLQAGTAVLVDAYGVPRAKCGCGNPLAPAAPLTTKTTYSGTRWSGFDPAKVVVVRQDVEVRTFVLVDVRTGDPFRRPVGSKGDDDVVATEEPPTTTTTAPGTTTTRPPRTTTTTAGASEGTSAPKLFSIESIAGVSNGPTAPSVAQLPAARITAIFTYHWNDAQGATPGTISLRSSTGEVYGPFQTTGSPGQGGVPNANWTAITNFEIPAGTYTVVDSSPETWAWAPDTGGRGMVIIWGVAS